MRSRPWLTWLFLALLAAPRPGLSQPVAPPPPIEGLRADVLHADQARLDAMLRADTAALDDLLASDCLYVHSSGSVQTKPELLGALASSALRYNVLHFATPRHVRFYGRNTAVLTGAMELEVQPRDRPVVKTVLLVTTVYVFQQNRWQLASYQSTVKPR